MTGRKNFFRAAIANGTARNSLIIDSSKTLPLTSQALYWPVCDPQADI